MRVLFFGTPDFSVPCLEALLAMPHVELAGVFTQPDRPAGRGQKLQKSPIKKLAEQYELSIFQPSKIKKEWEDIVAHSPKNFENITIGIVIAFGQILPKRVLDFPRCGCLNIHASLLPRWRGAAPIHRAILAGDQETGVGLMQMETTLDTGPVFIERRIPISPIDTTGTLHDSLAKQGALLLKENLEAIVEGKLSATIQTEDASTYAEKISSAEAEIDWTQSAQAIDRQVRACTPFPGAFTWVQGKRLKILQASPRESMDPSAEPGTLTTVDPTMTEVQCGTGALRLEQLQLEGRKKMPLSEFLRGVSLQLGDRLG